RLRCLSHDLPEISITPFGVDLDLFKSQNEPRDRDDEIVVGTVKALSPVYGIDLLIESFARMRAQVGEHSPAMAKRLRLRVVGDGPERQRLGCLARRRG